MAATSLETQGQLVRIIECLGWKFTVRLRWAPGHLLLPKLRKNWNSFFWLFLFFSTKELLCLTLSLDTHLGMNTYKAWQKTVLGAIMWFCFLQRITFKLPSVLSVVSTVRYLSSQIMHLLVPTPLCWDTFMNYTMWAFSPVKVKHSFQSQTSWVCCLDLWELCLKNLYT